LKLSPHQGQVLAQKLAGFLPPGVDSQEAEMRDTLGLWIKLHNSGSYETLKDTAWWMAGYQDMHRRKSRDELNQITDELATFAGAAIGTLIEQGILKFVNEPVIPQLVTSTFDPINQDIEQAVLDRMEAGMKKDET
jgi:hypothetical protein